MANTTFWRTNNLKIENHELKEVSIKNRTCYYFDDIIKIEDFDFDNILLDEKPYGNIFIYIRFHKVDVFIRVYDGTRYFVLFGPEKYDAIYNRIRYFLSKKVTLPTIFSHNYAKIKIDSYNYLGRKKH